MTPLKLFQENFYNLKKPSTFNFVSEEIIPAFSREEAENIFEKITK